MNEAMQTSGQGARRAPRLEAAQLDEMIALGVQRALDARAEVSETAEFGPGQYPIINGIIYNPQRPIINGVIPFPYKPPFIYGIIINPNGFPGQGAPDLHERIAQ